MRNLSENLKLKTKNWSLKNWSLLKTKNFKLKTILLLFAFFLFAALPAWAATRESVKVKPQIAGGGYYTIALKSDGTLWAWGYNQSGGLGDGTTVDKHSPVQIAISNVTSVATGNAHTIALKSNGTVWAWGENHYGQLGDGTTTDKSAPVQIEITDVVSIEVGNNHTIALKSDGTLWAWGGNYDGQLGDGTTINKTLPTQIGTDNKWVSISGGSGHTIALKSDGTLWAWGSNGHGQLGDGTTVNKSTPTQIGTDNKWISIAAGREHSVALKSDGTVWAWGWNSSGQVGNGTTSDKYTPVQIAITNVISVATGDYCTFALMSDGTLWAWGLNDTWQLGDSTNVNKTSPVQVGTDNKWTPTIASGSGHTLALKSDGTLWAWGYNFYGQLGDGTTVSKPSPAQIMQAGTGNEWGRNATSEYHSIDLKPDGTLWAWGYNSSGQFGVGSGVSNSVSPLQVETDNKWVSVSAGYEDTIGLKSDGTLWAWGRNDTGQLGDGTTINKSSPVQIGTDNKWASVSAGWLHTVALKSDGTLWAWGRNNWGQLGDGTTVDKYTPTQVGTDNKWVAIEIGYYHTLALKSDGTLWAWGYNGLGQLGDGTTTSKFSPIQIGTDNKWVSIAAGFYHSLGLKSDGTLWAWGYNAYGQLGDGTTVDKSSPIQIGTDNKWVSVAAGDWHTLALKSDGTLYAWGYNFYGQLGDCTTTNRLSPVQITGTCAIQLPRTGQTKCYDSAGTEIACTGTGQDGEYQAGVAWPSPRFTDNGDQTITDNLTGLMWTKDAGTPTVGSCTGGTMNWQAALDYVACLNTNNYLGHNDWRLPNVNELRSLVNYEQSNQAAWLNNQGFTNAQANVYCSSNSSAGGTGNAWHVYMLGGVVYYGGKNDIGLSVWPIRGGTLSPVYTVTPSAGTGGSISPSTPQTVSSDGTTSFTVTPNTGYHIASVTGCGGSLSGSTYTTGAIASDCTVSATFAINTYTVTPSAGSGGTISPNTPHTVNYNATTAFTISPNTGYHISSVTGCGGSLSGNTYTTGAIASDCTVSATFAMDTYTLSVNINPAGGGIVTGTGINCPGDCSEPYDAGTAVTITATPNSGYQFSSWTGCNSPSGNICLMTIDAAKSVTANFTVSAYTISASVSGGHGAISCTPTTVSYGGSSVCTITPEAGYHLSSLTENGNPVTGYMVQDTYTFSNITTDLNIIAIFAEGEWAIDLPQTGQTTCYDVSGNVITCTGTGQDGAIQAGVAWPEPRFTDNGDQTITDNLTGLIWTRDAGTPTVGSCTGGTMNWQAALDYVACLNSNNYLGHIDWRLPNINEIESLSNAGQAYTDIWLNSQCFTNVGQSNYWSSSTNAGVTGEAWYVLVVNGGVSIHSKSNSYYYVWPVRGGQSGLGNSVIWKTGQTISYSTGDDGDMQKGLSWPSPRLADIGDQTVTDNLTGLMWTKDAGAPTVGSCTGGAITWQQALDYVACVNSINYLGHNDWRLPNRKELFSLIDRSQYEPALPSGHPLTNVQSGYYWSASTFANGTGYAWQIAIGYGYEGIDVKTQTGYIWPVRGGQTGLFYNLIISKTGTGSGTVTSSPAGINCGVDCSEAYSYNTVVTLTASAITGSTFTGWSGACTGTGTCTVTMDAAKSVTATFTLNTYALTVSRAGTGSGTVTSNPVGINCGSDCSESYDYNTAVTLTASPAIGSTFAGWSGACTGTGACTVTMDAAKSVTATFTLNTYALNVSKTGTGSGTVTSSPSGINCGSDCSEVYTSGTIVTLSPTPNTGSTFTGWSGACTGTGTCAVTMDAAKSVTATFTLTAEPDLVVSALSLSATTVNVGDTIAITDTTKNQGYVEAGASSTKFYLSADTLIDGGDTELGSRVVSALGAGASESGTTISAAIPASAGANMYIIAKADAGSAVTETSEANNTMYKAIRVVKPDLVVTALSFNATVNAGDTVAITDTTKNQGTGPAGASTTSFYLSADTVLDGGDTLLSLNRSVSALAAGASETGTVDVNIPGGTTPGYKYIIAKADNGTVVGESNETNNTKYKAIKVVKPDLVVSALSLSATTVAIGGTINVTDTTRNNGAGAAVASTTRFYLSSDTVLGAGDTEIGAGRAVPALTAFVSGCATCLSTATTGVPIPVVAAGYYYVIAEADANSPEDVGESNETNNTRYSASKIRITAAP